MSVNDAGEPNTAGPLTSSEEAMLDRTDYLGEAAELIAAGRGIGFADACGLVDGWIAAQSAA